MKTRFRLTISILTLLFLPAVAVAQSLDSTTYQLTEPTIGPIQGISESTTYSQLFDTSFSNFTTTSTTYQSRGGSAEFFEANVPAIICFETDTDGGSTDCTGLPGSDGMRTVCSTPGCYDRAKVEIDTQLNPTDTRYAIQISTASDFSSGVFYVDSTTRLLKSNFTVSDFIPACEWEGTVSGSICPSPVSAYQRYNILGLTPNTTYYLRSAGLHGSAVDGSFTQSEWGPSASATTTLPQISFDIDIAPTTGGSSNPPFILNIGAFPAGVVATSSDLIIIRTTSNAIYGIETYVSGLNAGLEHDTVVASISAVNADLAVSASGYGLRNDATTNSSLNSGIIGSIDVSNSPSTFEDSGNPHEVGAPSLTPVKLFDSSSAPLDTGVSAYHVKVKASVDKPAGNYSELLTFIVAGAF